jgi:hypothetical protein
MAKIKTAYGKYSSNTNVDFARTQCGAVVSRDQSTIWIGDDALDYDTLNPFFAKTCGAFQPFGGNSYINGMETTLMINKPTAHASHNTAFDTLNDGYHARMAHIPNTWHKNLDKSERMDNGTMFRFLDSGGNPHTLVTHTFNNSNANSRFILFAGDSLDNPANSVQGLIPEASSTPSATLNGQGYVPVHADATNKVIYMYAQAYRPSYAFTTTYQFFKVPFTTIPVDGTLTLGTPVAISHGTQGSGRFFDSSPSWYCGRNNAGDAHFLTQVENEYLYVNTSAGTSRTPSNAVKTANSHRVVFTKYDPATSTSTTIADLKGNEGFVGDVNEATTAAADHNSFYTMTHFESSPIGGETDIYYAYSPCFDSATGDLGLLLHTWDKANDTFTTEVATMTFNGEDAVSDFITHAESSTITNNCLTLNTALTKDGSNYYLNVFYTHQTTDGLATFATSTEQTLLTMTISGTDFSSLSYHSDLAFPALGYAPQDADNTKWFVIEASNAALYSWSAAGWSKSASEAGACRAIGQDQDARYWSLMQNAADYGDITTFSTHLYGSYKPFNISLHLLSADLPTSVSVEFADDSITYAGSNLTKNLTVNAYDTDGNRIAKSVNLKITGSNAVFQSNNATSLTTTTLAGGDLTVPLTISGAGFINVSASFAI